MKNDFGSPLSTAISKLQRMRKTEQLQARFMVQMQPHQT